MWQALREDLRPLGVEIVTVALDLGGIDAVRPWIDAAAPSHPSLIDRSHVTDELLGFVNVPMAVWIDETGTLVRPAHVAQARRSRLRDAQIPDDLPERLRDAMAAVKRIPDTGDVYLPMVRDWAERGSASRHAFSPDEVVARSQPRPRDHAEAAACFELGQRLWLSGFTDDAVAWFRRAHELHPSNWTYKRQAWTLATTEPGRPSDLLQGPTDLYAGNWLDDIEAAGPESYYPPLDD